MNMKRPIIIALGLGISQFSFGEASPWLPSPGTLDITLSHVEQSAEDFYFGERERSLGADLDLSTTAIDIAYGINDYLALDAKFGYAVSDYELGNNRHFSGSTDSNIGITWQVVNEYASEIGLPSIAVRLGAIIAGSYEEGVINSIGDGGDGAELSIATGKSLNNYFAISSEVGFRDRSDDIPDSVFYNTALYFTPFNGFTTFVSYNVDDSLDGLDIGGPGFSPDRFPEVEEDKEYIQLGVQYAFTNNIRAGLSIAEVIEGRNTPVSDVYAFSISYAL